jgi:hypothetical protein
MEEKNEKTEKVEKKTKEQVEFEKHADVIMKVVTPKVLKDLQNKDNKLV